ncbi:MAG: DUF3179 domain-containing protein [Chitinophagaceae bacterium]|nr:DUF3179 domain-containing protein [Chitinophagaceae bacterium]
MRTFLLAAGFVLLFVSEILRVYLIMPFPGSQQANTIDLAYWLANNIWWLRLIALVLIAYPALHLFKQSGKQWKKIALVILLLVYAAVFYMIHYQLEADVMFYQPGNKKFAQGKANTVAPDKLVLGIVINGEAKAYPIQYIGYHHQVRDTVGGLPVMVTYCTVCRTGRVFSPLVHGKPEQFRLVGMDHFNAMFEDATTKSWWRQVSGEAITGPLKGTSLEELPSEQMILSAWQRKHPTTWVMQPDTGFTEAYAKMVNYEKGKSKGNLTRRDSLSWKDKSWVLGIVHAHTAKAYDWNELVKQQLIQDSLPGLPLVIVLEKDSASFHAWSRVVDGKHLDFMKLSGMDQLTDKQTGSVWNMDGTCVSGVLAGKQLSSVRAYQEYWHSWRSFQVGTLR